MPTRETAWPAGTPCWVDYSATDIDGAKVFYTEPFGWTYAGGQGEYGGYLNCQAKQLPAAGMMATMDPAQSAAWTTYVATDHAEATVAAVVSAGGTVVAAPMDVGPLGRMAIAPDIQDTPYGHFAVITDPWNAPFSIMQLADS